MGLGCKLAHAGSVLAGETEGARLEKGKCSAQEGTYMPHSSAQPARADQFSPLGKSLSQIKGLYPDGFNTAFSMVKYWDPAAVPG